MGEFSTFAGLDSVKEELDKDFGIPGIRTLGGDILGQCWSRERIED
jgi:hypothetical protein